MSYSPTRTALFVLRRPRTAGAFCILLGGGFGIAMELIFQNTMFARCGSLTVAAAIIVMGFAVEELAVRGQYSLIMADDGHPAEPFKPQQIRQFMTWQSFALFVGTLQWGFGDLVV
jgi:hypothetical protein